MEDLPETMSMREWCVLSYQACHVGDPSARLQLARLYKRCTHINDNMRYALFWLEMAHESYLSGGAANFVFARELSEEIRTVARELSDGEVEHVKWKAKYASKYSLGVSNQSAPSSEDAYEFRDGMCQY